MAFFAAALKLDGRVSGRIEKWIAIRVLGAVVVATRTATVLTVYLHSELSINLVVSLQTLLEITAHKCTIVGMSTSIWCDEAVRQVEEEVTRSISRIFLSDIQRQVTWP
jgi:hypothetical protein